MLEYTALVESLEAAVDAGGPARVKVSADSMKTFLDDAAEARLGEWKDRVATRGGAAKWIKSRLSHSDHCDQEAEWYDECPFQNIELEPAELAERVAKDWAHRWNCGLKRHVREHGYKLTSIHSAAPELDFDSQPPPRRQVPPQPAD